ncbi:NAC domain-containing protein 40-like isoform X2 [Euphorbia lathyris]|uniref:NAC domain-containing protein 40-like isoform X2 n=1 Tax=Euphorbia lathyris TaxID=212925 RepID=UPI00331431C4
MAGLSKETQMSIEASSKFPGFRFSPTDVELISYYLRKKMEGAEECVEVISEVEICAQEPWDLPGKSVIRSENEWFFFAARGRKYPNGSQSRRATELGYWKATGKERTVKSGSTIIGTKRTLVFHMGRAPKGERTEWIMHEYCMEGKSQDSLVVCRLRRNAEFRMNENTKRNSQNVMMPEKVAGTSRKCSSSSHDSHSIEHVDYASDETEQRLPLADGSSQHQEDSDNEDDFYADILKDDIIKLDETSVSLRTPSMPDCLPNRPQTQPQPVGFIKSQPLPSQSILAPEAQGTANRRIKLKRKTTDHSATKRVVEKGEGSKSSKRSKKPPSCVVDLFARKIHHRSRLTAVVLIFLILLLLLLLLSINGGSFQHMKRITYATLFRTS